MLFESGYTCELIRLKANPVGYMFRIEKELRAGEKKDWGHAGCILPNGQPVAFGFTPTSFVEATFEANSRFHEMKIEHEKGLEGQLKFYDQLPKVYRDARTAIKHGFQTAVLILEVSFHQAIRFENFWKKNPGQYNRYTHNCSSVCYEAFREAGIVKRTLLPIMTPKKLYNFVVENCGSRGIDCIEKTGYIGFEPTGYERYSLLIANKK